MSKLTFQHYQPVKLYTLILASAFPLINTLTAQDYVWPVKLGRVVSSNFADPRPRRFHAGLDISTQGTKGHEVVAIDNGYVERIRVSSDGYGRVLYQKLSDNKTVVYAHLDGFTELIDAIVRVEQGRNRSYEIDKYFRANEMLVNKGDFIGYSGDSGGAFGPHLHFEVRDTLNRPINPFTNGFGMDDRHRPKPDRLAFIPLSIDAVINGGTLPQIFPLHKKSAALYELPDTIHVFNTVGLALSAIDEITGFNIKYNITGCALFVDDVEQFRLEFDHYSFTKNHLTEMTVDNSLRRLNDGNFYRLFTMSSEAKSDFVKGNGHGRLTLSPGYHTISLRLFDHARNVSLIQGTLYFAPPTRVRAEILSETTSTITIAIRPDGSPFPITDFVCYAFNAKGYPEVKVDALSKERADRALLVELPKKLTKNRILQFIGINSLGGVSEAYHLPFVAEEADHMTTSFQLSVSHLEKSVILEVAARGYFQQTANLSLKGSKLVNLPLKQVRPGVFHSSPLKPQDLAGKEEATFTISSSAVREMRFHLNPELSTGAETVTAFSGDGKCFLKTLEHTFYDTTAFWIEVVENPVPLETGRFTSRVYQLQPFDRALKDSATVKILLKKSESAEKKGVFYYDQKEGWTYLPSKFSIVDRLFSAPLYSFEAVAVVEDTVPPRIHDFSPGPNANYSSKDFTTISGKVEDDLAGIGRDKDIQMILDGESLYFEYHPIKKEVRYRLNGLLDAGQYQLVITATDQVGNRATKEITFSVN